MQRHPAVVMKIAVKVPIQKASVSQSVTRQYDGVLPPITFAVYFVKEEIHEEKTHVIGLKKPTILLSSISKLWVFLSYFQLMVRQKPRKKGKDFLPFYQS